MELGVEVTYSGGTTGSLSGTYSLQAAAYSDGTLDWASSSDLAIGDPVLGLGVGVTSAGVLKH